MSKKQENPFKDIGEPSKDMHDAFGSFCWISGLLGVVIGFLLLFGWLEDRGIMGCQWSG